MGESSRCLHFLSYEEAEGVIEVINVAAELQSFDTNAARRLLAAELQQHRQVLDGLLMVTEDDEAEMSSEELEDLERMELEGRSLIRQLVWAIDLLAQDGVSVTSPFNPLTHAYFRRQDTLRCQRRDLRQRESTNTSAQCGCVEVPPMQLPPELCGRADKALLRQFLVTSSMLAHRPGDGDEDSGDPISGCTASEAIPSVDGPDLDAVPGPSGESRRGISISPFGPNAGDVKDQKPPTDAEEVSCVTPSRRPDENTTAASRDCAATSTGKPSEIARQGGSEVNIAQTPGIPHGACHDKGEMAGDLGDESADSDFTLSDAD